MKKLFNNIVNSLELNVHKKMSPLFIILSILSVTSLIVSNIVAAKSVSLFNWQVDGFNLSIASSFIVFPFTYIISDLFSEIYGYAWSRKISWISFFADLFMVGIIELTILMPGVDETFSVEYENVLGSSLGILAASLIAYMCGDLLNDIVFKRLKARDKYDTNFSFIFRSIVSSLCGEIMDSLVFLPLLYLAINGYGTIIQSFSQLITIVVIQGVLKTCFELVLSPLSVFITNKVKKYEKSLEETKA